MSQAAWQRGDDVISLSSLNADDEDLQAEAAEAEAAAEAERAPDVGIWGPEMWPEGVRENVDVWPPRFRERQLLATVRTPLSRPRRIALLSRKESVGKSSTAGTLRRIFSTYRTEPAVVVSATGPIRDRQDLPAFLDHNDGELELRGVVQRLPQSRLAHIVGPSNETDYGKLIELLTEPYPIVIADVGTGLNDRSLRQILDHCDQVVVIATPAVDGLYAGSACLDRIRDLGYGHLVDDAIVVINRIRRMAFSDLLTIDRYFARRCREVIRIPFDARLGDVAIGIDELRPSTRTGFFELAAAIARSFNEAETHHQEMQPQEK